ncbi:MAG: DUF4352 domain-containing protein [Desulfitobacteriia bacterium]|jgi:ABC-type Fe3+-hydroxamate transport system substrate-binding protein
MKKIMSLLLSMVLALTLSACGGNGSSESAAPSSVPTEGSKAPSGQTAKEEVNKEKVYGIGEAAEADGLAITIDKVTAPDPDMFINKPDEGFVFMQVYYTFKNVSKETIETPKRKAIYIVYKEGPTGDDSEMTADHDSDILPGKKGDMYRGFVELAPGESTSGWLMYQRPSDKSEVTMHYYSKFINVPPALVFRFAAE